MESVVAALCANALVLAALTYLVKSIMTHRLNKDILEFKRTLGTLEGTETLEGT